MNFLQICQRVHDIVGYQGQFTSVETTGYQQVVVTAVKDAYEDVQRYRADWDYLKYKRSINVDNSQSEYTLQELWGSETPDLAEYRFIDYNKRQLTKVDYDDFVLLEFSEAKEPQYWSVEPWSKSLLISPVDMLYTLDLHYNRSLDTLSVNTDVPLIPLRHHQILVYGAIMKLATFVGNPTLYDTYAVKYAEELGQLMREENPVKRVTKRPIA